MDVPIYYDPMLSKLITYGKDRNEAIQIMLKAIQEYKVEGVSTTLPFGTFVFEHEAFVSGNFDTNFVKKFYSVDIIKENQAKEAEVAALVALKQYFADQKVLCVPTKL